MFTNSSSKECLIILIKAIVSRQQKEYLKRKGPINPPFPLADLRACPCITAACNGGLLAYIARHHQSNDAVQRAESDYDTADIRGPKDYRALKQTEYGCENTHEAGCGGHVKPTCYTF